jgi:hypothetical protein
MGSRRKNASSPSPDSSKFDVVKRQIGDVHGVALRFIAISMS